MAGAEQLASLFLDPDPCDQSDEALEDLLGSWTSMKRRGDPPENSETKLAFCVEDFQQMGFRVDQDCAPFRGAFQEVLVLQNLADGLPDRESGSALACGPDFNWEGQWRINAKVDRMRR